MLELKKNYLGLSYIALNSKLLPNDEVVDLTGETSSEQIPRLLLEHLKNTLDIPYMNVDTDGYMPLRECISDYFFDNYSYRYNPHTEITINSGHHQAYSTIISTLIKDGDEVIVFEPSYFTYLPTIEANGGRPVYLQLKQPDFHINWEEVQKVITTRTRLIVLNSPHHVTGSILNASDFEKLSKIINGTKILILSDETYAPLLYEGYEHQSVARYPKLIERTFIISGFSKILNTDNWQLSFCLAPEKLMANFRKVQLFQVFSASLPFQIALANFLKEGFNSADVTNSLQNKRDLLLKNLKNTKLNFLPTVGSYFQIINYAKVSILKDTLFSEQLLTQHKLNAVPLSLFFHEQTDLKYIRVNFARKDEVLIRANEILQNLS
jgi:methionine transaminase